MADFLGKKILVVGGAGFVGSNLTNRLLGSGARKVIVVDNLLSADISRVATHENLEFIYGSINEDTILYNLPDDLDYVFHLATYHGNQSSIENPLKDHEHNTLTSLNLFDRISKFKQLQKVVYSSAGCTVAKKTFDHADPTIEQEDVSLYLDSPYQMSKIFGEFYGNYYFMRYGMPFVKARFQNVYGPREILGAGMVHPFVLESAGIDSKVYSGFAFGVDEPYFVLDIFVCNTKCLHSSPHSINE